MVSGARVLLDSRYQMILEKRDNSELKKKKKAKNPPRHLYVYVTIKRNEKVIGKSKCVLEPDGAS